MGGRNGWVQLASRVALKEYPEFWAGSFTATLAIFAVVSVGSVSIWYWFFARDFLYAGFDYPFYNSFLYYPVVALLGYGLSRLLFGKQVLKFANSNKESMASLAMSAIVIAVMALAYVKYQSGFLVVYYWPEFLNVMVLSPIAEEVFYRLFFLTVLVKLTQRVAWSIILNSLLFMIAHLTALGGATVVFLLGAASFSVVSGFVFLYTKNLSTAIGLHFAFNVTTFYIAYFL